MFRKHSAEILANLKLQSSLLIELEKIGADQVGGNAYINSFPSSHVRMGGANAICQLVTLPEQLERFKQS
jgi:hypothetical protein